MVYRSQPYIFAENKRSVFLCDPVVRANDALGGDTPQADYDFGAQKESLVFQVRHAGLLLPGMGITVPCL